MAIYSLSLNTTVTTTGASAGDLLASATNAPRLMEFGATLGAATASTYGLGRSGNTPTQTGAVAFQAENPNDPASQTNAAVAFGTAPTVPTQFFRRFGLPGTIGAGFIVTFPRGLILTSAKGFEFWNLATNSANTNFYAVIDE